MSNNLTTQQNYIIGGFDDIDDFGALSVIDSTGLLSHQPRNRISLEGKMFTYEMADGNKVDGGHEIEAVILNVSPYQYRTYFTGTHGNPDSKVVCASSNGLAPDDWVATKQSASCVLCSHSAKGSGNGGIGLACGQRKDIAVLTSKYPTTPFVISLSVTSIISLRNYVTDLTKQLRTAGKLKEVKAIAPIHLFVTKLTFQSRDKDGKPIGYPVLQFNYASTLPRANWADVQALAVSEETKKLIKIDADSLALHKQPTGNTATTQTAPEPQHPDVHTLPPAPAPAPIAAAWGATPSPTPATSFSISAQERPLMQSVQQSAASIIEAQLAAATQDDGFFV